jgi:hypothetical protein
MKILVVAGIVLLLSGPLMVGWIYAVNPSDFYSNIAGPLFDGVVLGLAGLGVISLVLSRVSLNPRYAVALGITFILLPVVIFVAGNATAQTACFGPCGNWPPQVSISGCSMAGFYVVCTLATTNAGSPHAVDVTGCSIQIQKNEFPWGGNQTGNAGLPGGNTGSLNQGSVFTCSIAHAQPSTGSFVYLFIHFSSGLTIGIGPYIWK